MTESPIMPEKVVTTWFEMEQARKEGWIVEGYILRKKKEEKPKLDWNSLPWHCKEGKESFSWVYVNDAAGHAYPNLQVFVEALKKEGDIWDGKVQYILSKDCRYINRIIHNGERS